MVCSPRLLYKLFLFFIWPFLQDIKMMYYGASIYLGNKLCCNSVWYLFNFLDASVILKQQHFYWRAGFGLCLGWRDCFTLRLGFVWEEAQTERSLDTLNMSPLISKLPFSNILYTASANRALTRGEEMLLVQINIRQKPTVFG